MHPIAKPSASGEPGRTSVIVCCSPLDPLVSLPPQVVGTAFNPGFAIWTPSFRSLTLLRPSTQEICDRSSLSETSGCRRLVLCPSNEPVIRMVFVRRGTLPNTACGSISRHLRGYADVDVFEASRAKASNVRAYSSSLPHRRQQEALIRTTR